MVKVYSITVCPWCTKVKRYLKYRGIPYEEHNIEHDPAALAECKALSGDTIVPVTTADGKDFALSYDREKLEKNKKLPAGAGNCVRFFFLHTCQNF